MLCDSYLQVLLTHLQVSPSGSRNVQRVQNYDLLYLVIIDTINFSWFLCDLEDLRPPIEPSFYIIRVLQSSIT